MKEKTMYRSVVIVALILTASICHAHGTRCGLFDGVAAIEAGYDDGRPMAFCDVTVYFPAGGQVAVAAGETDADGRFSFFPDSDGEYRIVVDDGMGHSARLDLRVENGKTAREEAGVAYDEDSNTGAGNPLPARLGKKGRIVIGLSLIFGIFGIVSLLRSRWGLIREGP